MLDDYVRAAGGLSRFSRGTVDNIERYLEGLIATAREGNPVAEKELERFRRELVNLSIPFDNLITLIYRRIGGKIH